MFATCKQQQHDIHFVCFVVVDDLGFDNCMARLRARACFGRNLSACFCTITPCGTRTRNLRILIPTPCPFGQGGRCIKQYVRHNLRKLRWSHTLWNLNWQNCLCGLIVKMPLSDTSCILTDRDRDIHAEQNGRCV